MATQLSECFLNRYKLDLKELYTEQVDGIFVAPDEAKLTLIHALIIGPPDSPYEGGFFYFQITLPKDYPINHPGAKIMTTGQGSVRFNPNLYACGKVCLSIIGTWAGPSWTSVMTLQSLLLSIRSLIHEKPYFSEPGYESQSKSTHAVAASEDYNRRVRYDTMRVAIRGMLNDSVDNRQMPDALKGAMKKYFKDNFSRYQTVFTRNLNSGGLLNESNKVDYKKIMVELESYNRKKEADDELFWVMYTSIREKFAPPPPPPTEPSVLADVDQFNEYLADTHADDSELSS